MHVHVHVYDNRDNVIVSCLASHCIVLHVYDMYMYMYEFIMQHTCISLYNSHIKNNMHSCIFIDVFRLVPREFNSYGSRRGNDDIMARGTFANIRLVNKFIGKAMPKTIHIPSNEQVTMLYIAIICLLLMVWCF